MKNTLKVTTPGDREIVLSVGITELGGSSEPAGGLGEIARSAFALAIGMAKVPLGNRILLMGSGENQAERLCGVFMNAQPMKVEVGKVVLRHGVSLKSGPLIAFRSLSVIASDTAAVLVEVTDKELGACIALRCP